MVLGGKSVVIGEDKCKFEFFIINDGRYTDYDIGEIFDYIRENGYDLAEYVVEVADEIATELYKTTTGQFKFLIEINFTYEKDYDYYYGAYEYDMDFDYTVVSKEESNYFDELSEE